MSFDIQNAIQENLLFKNVDLPKVCPDGLKGTLIYLEDGDVLFREPEKERAFYLVLEGEVNIIKKNKGKLGSEVFKENHFFLNFCLFNNGTEVTTAVALFKSTLLCILESDLKDLISADEQITRNVFDSYNHVHSGDEIIERAVGIISSEKSEEIARKIEAKGKNVKEKDIEQNKLNKKEKEYLVKLQGDFKRKSEELKRKENSLMAFAASLKQQEKELAKKLTDYENKLDSENEDLEKILRQKEEEFISRTKKIELEKEKELHKLKRIEEKNRKLEVELEKRNLELKRKLAELDTKLSTEKQEVIELKNQLIEKEVNLYREKERLENELQQKRKRFIKHESELAEKAKQLKRKEREIFEKIKSAQREIENQRSRLEVEKNKSVEDKITPVDYTDREKELIKKANELKKQEERLLVQIEKHRVETEETNKKFEEEKLLIEKEIKSLKKKLFAKEEELSKRDGELREKEEALLKRMEEIQKEAMRDKESVLEEKEKLLQFEAELIQREEKIKAKEFELSALKEEILKEKNKETSKSIQKTQTAKKEAQIVEKETQKKLIDREEVKKSKTEINFRTIVREDYISSEQLLEDLEKENAETVSIEEIENGLKKIREIDPNDLEALYSDRDISLNYDYIEHQDIRLVFVNITRATFSEAIDFKNFMVDALEGENVKVIVDLKKTEFVDSTFLGALLSSLKLAKSKGGRFKLVIGSSVQTSLFMLSQVDKMFEIFDNLNDAYRDLLNSEEEIQEA